MSNIKTWQERQQQEHIPATVAMQAEITDLRTALAERDAECGKLRAIAERAAEMETVFRTAAQQALEALEELRYSSTTFKADKLYSEAKAALTATLESK